jgi:Lrp/AsnC family transcriptional regulator for asnA, asnC and gidA
MQPDQIDWKIIDILRDGYEGTIRARLKRLKKAGILTVKALINPDVLENKQLVMVAMNVAESRLLEHKAGEIARLSGVLSVSIASGRFDLMAEVLVDSNKGLVRFLTEELSTIEGITRSESFIMLKNYNKFV